MEKCSICDKEIVTCAMCGATGQYANFANRDIYDTPDNKSHCYHLCPTCNSKLNEYNINLFKSNIINIIDVSDRV